eukprot:CAMPEP_0174361852 /NCGR_PEP_ID=MMETSP0811_2-20130205/61343_1 /TAXON_ID=73025 ORGANISM="Eutreptiella gymnastica-like, Strain CCMP1594" /NCGR_SAMPLE_ID=MMETSP0811_2 /ASSEMBLY_ACC=CAM_ASM_000667 /LENGTH=132 /DNA_ID=CAMNT_0015498907 /DNA_START=57 /DNA_END=452 /DNA_ORIENTATION=-
MTAFGYHSLVLAFYADRASVTPRPQRVWHYLLGFRPWYLSLDGTPEDSQTHWTSTYHTTNRAPEGQHPGPWLSGCDGRRGGHGSPGGREGGAPGRGGHPDPRKAPFEGLQFSATCGWLLANGPPEAEWNQCR